jgi:hypothetical protein
MSAYAWGSATAIDSSLTVIEVRCTLIFVFMAKSRTGRTDRERGNYFQSAAASRDANG